MDWVDTCSSNVSISVLGLDFVGGNIVINYHLYVIYLLCEFWTKIVSTYHTVLYYSKLYKIVLLFTSLYLFLPLYLSLPLSTFPYISLPFSASLSLLNSYLPYVTLPLSTFPYLFYLTLPLLTFLYPFLNLPTSLYPSTYSSLLLFTSL